MKRSLPIVILLALAVTLTVSAVAQSLGDLAREQRKKKGPASPTTKVYTNDNLPRTTSLTIVSGPGGSEAAAEPASSQPASRGAAASGKGETAAAADPAAAEAEWRARIGEQKSSVASLERELDLLQRENRLQGASFYADAGTRLRDEAKFAEQQRKFQADIAAKQQELEAAKQKLEDLREELRRAGHPSSWGE